MAELFNYACVDGVGIVTIDAPPVNTLGAATRAAVMQAMQLAWADDAAKAIIIACAGRTFFAGADIAEFATGQFADPDFITLFDAIENGPKPVIAAIHGTALGGGLELALHCHYRLAVPSAKLGLPEVNLGILPGAGGTQRLPRLVGVPVALDLITSGKPIKAAQALELGILDRLANEGQLQADAMAFAKEVIASGAPKPRVRDRDDKIAPYRGKPEVFDAFRAQNARAFKGFKAPEAIIKAVQAAVESPHFDEGSTREQALFLELMNSPESKAQRHVFFAQRMTAKVPDVPADTPTRDLKRIGVIGAGTMGGGIAMNFLNIGLPVTLVELKQDALDRGVGVIRKNYENSAAKGRMTPEQVEQRMALITPALGLEALADVDLVIEAVFESMAVKQDVFSKLDAICKPGAILASNTSFLDLNEIAAATKRQQDVIGLHFFSPANVMPLLEIVRGAKTDKSVLASALNIAKAIGKTPVVAGVCHGFIANRAMEPYMAEAEALVLEGASVLDIDRVIRDYGFAMGPFQMLDLIGLDVIGRDSTRKTVMSELVKRDRLGQKKNGGYYDYDAERKATLSPVALEVIAALAAEKGVAQRSFSDEELLGRLLYPVVNEGAKILEEKIASRPSDIDVALIMGYNWPVYRGGPMFWADLTGLPKIVAALRGFETAYGARYTPAALLVQLADAGKGFGSL